MVMIAIPAGIGVLLVTLQSPVPTVRVSPSVFSSARLSAATASLIEKSFPAPGSAVRRRKGGPGMTVAGVLLAVSGAGMIVLNSAGLAEGTTIPPGGERDGYLGKPGVVIGAALVVTGIVLIVR